MIALFLVTAATSVYSQEELTFAYYVQGRSTTALPPHIDENALTDEDREELLYEEDEYEDCDENDDYDFWEWGNVFDLDKTTIIAILEFEGWQVTNNQGNILEATLQEDEDDGVMILKLDLDNLIFEQQILFIGDDNPFFNEAGNYLWGIMRVNFIRTSEGYVVPEKYTEIEYDVLSSGVPYQLTWVENFLYYEVKSAGNTIAKTGNEKLFNDCMGLTGMAQMQGKTEMNIYPNPAKEQITLSFSSFMEENMNIEIFNALGAKVLQRYVQGGQIDMDIHSLPAGVYMLRCTNKDKVITKRFVKQK
jgi:hypothetical protein